MRIGLVTDGLADMPLDRLLPTVAGGHQHAGVRMRQLVVCTASGPGRNACVCHGPRQLQGEAGGAWADDLGAELLGQSHCW